MFQSPPTRNSLLNLDHQSLCAHRFQGIFMCTPTVPILSTAFLQIFHWRHLGVIVELVDSRHRRPRMDPRILDSFIRHTHQKKYLSMHVQKTCMYRYTHISMYIHIGIQMHLYIYKSINTYIFIYQYKNDYIYINMF